MLSVFLKCWWFSCLVCILGSGTGIAENAFLPPGTPDLGWPTIRGPHLDGHSDEIHIADSWPQEGPPVLWTRKLGQGYSSMVAVDDRVFTQYQTLEGQFVLCLDAATGETIWKHRYAWAYEATGLYPGPRSTPTIDEHKIYFTTPDAVVGCLDWDGKPIWSVDLKSQHGSHGTEFGFAASPIIANRKVLLPLGGQNASMVALDADTGKLVWKSGNEPASYVPAYPVTVARKDQQDDSHPSGNRDQVIGYLQHAMVGFDLETGDSLWQVDLSQGYDEHSAWPIFHDGLLWISSPFQGGSQLFRFSDAGRPVRVRQSGVMSNDVASSVLVDGSIYGFDLREAQSKAHRPSRGEFRCIDFVSGEVNWSNGNAKKRRSEDFLINAEQQIIGQASILVADGKLILLTDLGELILAEANPNRFIQLARMPILGGEIGWGTPALHRGRLFVRNHSQAVCVHLGEREFIPGAQTDNAIPLGELRQQSFHDWSELLGVEPEYAMDPPSWPWLKSWYTATTLILIAAMLTTAMLITAAASFTVFHQCSPSSIRVIFLAFAFAGCLITGKFVSEIQNDFVFTWPGCLFLAFHAAVDRAQLTRRSTSRPRGHITASLFFLATCVFYFFVCRRLSLVTQWTFLLGFSFALPFSLLSRGIAKRPRWTWRLAECAVCLTAFTAFYWGSAVILWLKYEIASH